MSWLRRVWRGGGRSGQQGDRDDDQHDGRSDDAGPSRSGEPGRIRGEPPSGNGASSMHLFWSLPGHFSAAEVSLEVLEQPQVQRLYFWALQANFTDGGRTLGGAHLGLQWHPSYPYRTAVNWGGYRTGGGELAGSRSPLPGSLGNPHTRDYHWSIGVPYRLRIERGDRPGSWRGCLHDPVRGATVAVRELYPGGSHLCSLMMWSEVFARCEHPPVTVRWSDPVAFDDRDAPVRPEHVTVNYQSHRDGGCANTTAFTDDHGICQRTASARLVPQGARLRVS